MNVHADAHHSKINRPAGNLRFDQDAASFAIADHQIVGPAQVNSQAGDGANGIGSGQPGSQRKQRQAEGGNRRPQEQAYIKPFARSRVPRMIAASTPGSLLISKVNRAVRRGRARSLESVGVGGVSGRRKMQLARKDGSPNPSLARCLERGQVIHVQRCSAHG